MSGSKKNILTQNGKKLLSSKKNIPGYNPGKYDFGYIVNNNHHFILANRCAEDIEGSDKDKKKIAEQKRIAERILVHFLHEYNDFVLSECKDYTYNSNEKCYIKNNKPKNNKFYGLVEVLIDIYADKLAKICNENKKLISSYDRNKSSKKTMPTIYFKCTPEDSSYLTPDNKLNQFLKTTAEYLIKHTHNKATEQRLIECKKAMRVIMPHFTSYKILKKSCLNKNSEAEKLLKNVSPDNGALKDLYNLAKLFYNIKDYKLSYPARGKLGFVFRDNNLYEKFIGRILEKCNIEKLTENQETTIATGETSKEEIKIETDYVVKKKLSHAPIILDAKFKDYDKKPSNSDIYQVITYAIHYKSKNTVLIYPRLNNKHEKGIIDAFHLKDIDKKLVPKKIHIVMLDLLGEDDKLLSTEYLTDTQKAMNEVLGKIN